MNAKSTSLQPTPGMVVCMGDGVQDDPLNAVPRHFDFQREVLDGPFLDGPINRFLIRLVFQHLSTEGLKPWNHMTGLDFMNYMTQTYRYHSMLNHNAISDVFSRRKISSLRPASDNDILAHIESGVRLHTPNDVGFLAETIGVRRVSWSGRSAD